MLIVYMPTIKPQRMLQLFSQNVRRLRMEAGISQELLAQRCIKYKKQIPRIENGTADVNLSMIVVLAQALDVEPGVLLQRHRTDH